jgi:hypothetical protein
MELQGRRKNAYLGEDSNGDEDEGDDPSSGRRTSYSSLSFSISLPSLSCFWFTFPCVTFLVLPFSLSVSSSVLSIALLCYLLNCFTLFSLQSFCSPLSSSLISLVFIGITLLCSAYVSPPDKHGLGSRFLLGLGRDIQSLSPLVVITMKIRIDLLCFDRTRMLAF